MSRFLRAALAMLLCASLAIAGKWEIPDSGSTFPYGKGTGDGGTHMFHNKGRDASITVICYSPGGHVYSVTELLPGNDANVHIPKGGSCQVRDDADKDELGATGTFT